jgi:hypothetical protein
MLGKKFGPAIVLPILMFFFGSFTLLMGKSVALWSGSLNKLNSLVSVQNFGGVMALRWFLGQLPFLKQPSVIRIKSK